MHPRQAIVYDAVGTLLHVTPSVAVLYAQVGRRFGSRLGVAEVRRRFPVAFARQEEMDRAAGWRTDEAREWHRWRDIVGAVLSDVNNPAACFEALWIVFGQADAWTVDAEAAAVIEELQLRGVQQAVASNFDRRLSKLMESIPDLRPLNPIVVSSEVGWRKPAPEFFRHLADALQLPPSEILFIGDDRGNDYDAARAAGMEVLLFDPANKHLDVPERITRLSALI